ncbi:MAG: DMT family transporter [Pseudomonadota bacterium]
MFSSPYILLSLTALFWAGNAVAGKLAAGLIPPFTLTAIRWTGSAIILYMLARPHLEASKPELRKNWRFLALMGAIGFAGFNFALYGALNFTTAINAAIEQSAMPVIVILLGYFLFGERVRRVQMIGVSLSIVGVIVTVSRGDLGSLLRLDINIGDAIMVFAVIFYSGYSAFLRKKPPVDWRVFMFALATAAACASIPVALIETFAFDQRIRWEWQTPVLLIYVTLFPSLLAQIFFVRGVELIGPNRASIFINLVPVLASGLAILILGERFEVYHAIGLALVLGGITLAEQVRKNA